MSDLKERRAKEMPETKWLHGGAEEEEGEKAKEEMLN